MCSDTHTYSTFVNIAPLINPSPLLPSLPAFSPLHKWTTPFYLLRDPSLGDRCANVHPHLSLVDDRLQLFTETTSQHQLHCLIQFYLQERNLSLPTFVLCAGFPEHPYPYTQKLSHLKRTQEVGQFHACKKCHILGMQEDGRICACKNRLISSTQEWLFSVLVRMEIFNACKNVIFCRCKNRNFPCIASDGHSQLQVYSYREHAKKVTQL
jgi:hypothetical protein